VAPIIRFNVLGRFEALRSDGEPVELNAKKIQALLAYLAGENGRPHTRDRLAGLLWSETGDERARHNLRQALAKIRRSYGEVLRSRGDALQIDLGACSVDVSEFERLAESDDPDELRRGLQLYRGDLMEGLIPREPLYDEWLPVARTRLRKIACKISDRLATKLVEHGRLDEAIEALDHRLIMDPACEPAHRDLMELFARVGRRSDALRQYQSCEAALRRELGTEPSPETKAVRARIRDADPDVSAVEAPRPETGATRIEHDAPAVAVLPFDNLSGDGDAYFVDGIAEDIITALSRFRSLRVIARGSSFACAGRDTPEREIADKLGAQFLVRGSVQRSGKRVRIGVQLLDARAGVQVWGERFDREMEDVFLIQDEITSTITSTLVGRVEAARLAQARRAPAERLDAYDSLLRGKDHHHRFTAEDCSTCIDMFGRAIERDPTYAVAHAWLACGLGQAMNFKLDDVDKLLDECQSAAERGLELDENESECHRILAQVFLQRRKFERAFGHQERALFLNPNDDRTVCAMGEILALAGKSEEAEGWVRQAMRLNPYHPLRYWMHVARPLFHLGRYKEALSALAHIARPRKDELAYRVACAARLGDPQVIERHVSELREAIPNFDSKRFVQGLVYRHESDRSEVLDALEAAGL
jgi:TolB-like protein/Tfp pilus assembly protein PilF